MPRSWTATLLVLLLAGTGCKAKPNTPGGPISVADTAGCGFVPRLAHPHPAELLAEYLRRDGDGEFTRSDMWRDEAMACPAHGPGWDGFTLIASYQSTRLDSVADTVRYLVSYTRLGLLDQDPAGFFIKPDSAQELDTVVVIRTAYGWRIDDWDDEPHLLPAGALKLPTLRESDRKALRARQAGR